jgi:hypothetical protein
VAVVGAASLRLSRVQVIKNDQELESTLERIRHFQALITHLRNTETNPTNYRLSASGFLAEIDKMQLEVREYFSAVPSQMKSFA